jgi:Zn-dependent membrane protease YugP
MFGYLLLIVITCALGFGTQAYIKHTFAKWSKVAVSTQLTGAQAARAMLDANGLSNVAIQQVSGQLSDHYDPRTNVVSLSQDVYSARTVAATAVACHECGHAVQHALGYAPIKVRDSMVPVVNIASNAWMFVLIAGIFLQIIGLVWIAIILYAAVLLFQLVTLPVEFNASRRGMAYIRSYGIPQSEGDGARSVLTSAAMTYVAAALSSVLVLLYYLGFTRNN